MRIQKINSNYQNNYQNKKSIGFKMNTCFFVEGLNCPMNKLGEKTLAVLIKTIQTNLEHFKRVKPHEEVCLLQGENAASTLLVMDGSTAKKLEKMTSDKECQQLVDKIIPETVTIRLNWAKIRPDYTFH